MVKHHSQAIGEWIRAVVYLDRANVRCLAIELRVKVETGSTMALIRSTAWVSKGCEHIITDTHWRYFFGSSPPDQAMNSHLPPSFMRTSV